LEKINAKLPTEDAYLADMERAILSAADLQA
jgi:hypothetical protein